MKAWQFEALKALSRGEKIHGVLVAELKEEGLIFLEGQTECWLPTPEANEAFKVMLEELKAGSTARKGG